MRARQRPLTVPRRAARRTWLATAAAVLSALASLSAAGSASAGTASVRVISYLGYRFAVPRSWPVIDESARPRGCVRFDRHAVYLGAAAVDQACPSWLLGTTESVLIAAAPAAAGRRSVENPVAREITATAPGVSVTATFGSDPTQIYRILASAGMAAPVPQVAQPAGVQAAAARMLPAGRQAARSARLPRVIPRPPLPETVANFHGLGFDACAAPSSGYMAAWRRSSPYRAVGIYIGGSDRACAQPNLTAAWVGRQAQAGWRFIPLYAGPQAAFGELSAPVSQGQAAAADAAVQAQRLGFGPRTPIYYDMEAYSPGSSRAALSFLSAWTSVLRRYGYTSAVYSSSLSGIRDLAARYASGYPEPGVIYDALWNGSATTFDHVLRPGQWADHHRIHQFSGNVTQTYGGATINIDRDYLDVSLAQPVTTAQPSSAVTLPDGAVDVFYVRSGHRIWFQRRLPGAGWTRPADTGASSDSAPSAVWTGRSLCLLYRGAGGMLWADTYRPAGGLTGRHQLTRMGAIGSPPRAVAQPGGLIDVFWRGSADAHLWHAQFSPRTGWSGPQGLGGSLGSAPAPVVSAPGHVEVFWKGADSALWHVTRGLTGRWHPPSSLGMGPLGGAPLATAQPAGDIQVVWKGEGIARLWEAVYQPGIGWHGAKDLGGSLTSAPWPVTGAGTVRVLWRGRNSQLYSMQHLVGKLWGAAGWAGPVRLRMGRLAAQPFAAAGGIRSAVQAFWRGSFGGLWTAWVSQSSGGWSGPTGLGGSRSLPRP